MVAKPTPFAWIHEAAQPRMLAVLGLLLVASSLWTLSLDRALVTHEASNAVISFELAGSFERSDEILRAWSADARRRALLLQGADSLYLFVYPAWLSLATVRLTRRMTPGGQRFGLRLAWLVLAAAPLDAVENYALIEQLLQGADPILARIAWLCAVPKFALLCSTAGFLVVGGIVSWTRRPRSA